MIAMRQILSARRWAWPGLLRGALLSPIVCGCAELPSASSVDAEPLRAGAHQAHDLEQSLRAYTASSSSEPLARNESPPRRQSSPLREVRVPDARFETTRITSPPVVEEHVGSRRRIDVKLHQADLTEALRFIAHSGGINLVVAQGVVGQVNVELRRVTPFAALRAIAQAHGARIVQADASGSGPILIVEPAR